MASLFTRAEAIASGLSYETIRWRVRKGTYVRLAQGVYFKGDRRPVQFERRLALAMRSDKPVTGEVAAALYGFDGFDAPRDGDYDNVPRTGERETLFAIAATTTDIRWEWALEWALRKQHTTIAEVEEARETHRRGNGRIRRVLKLRERNAPATGSVLETIAVQLIRRNPAIPTPKRQVPVKHWYVDLAWPDHGVFLELDGEWHKDQPKYDAVRQTGVTAATGWLVGRFTWTDIVQNRKTTLQRVIELIEAGKSKRAS